MKREKLEKELELTLNNLRDIKSNKLKAQCLTDTLYNLGLIAPEQKSVVKVQSPLLNKYFKAN